jgi:hypothetical protein
MDTTLAPDGHPPDAAPPRTIGRALLTYRNRRGWDDAALAAFLGCDAWGLAHLAFIPHPQLEPTPTLAENAALAGCEVERLAIALADADASADV